MVYGLEYRGMRQPTVESLRRSVLAEGPGLSIRYPVRNAVDTSAL